MKTLFRAVLVTLLLAMLPVATLSAGVSPVSGGTAPPIYFPFVEHVGIPNQLWTSYLEIHNRSSTVGAFTVFWYNSDGSVFDDWHFDIGGKGTIQVIPPGPIDPSFIGAAVVVPESSAITAIARWDYQSAQTMGYASQAAYAGISEYGGGANAGWGVPGTTIYAPWVEYGTGSDWQQTTLHIQNAGSALVWYIVTYFDADGNQVCRFPWRSLNPKGWEHMAFPAEACGVTDEFVGSARIEATEPLAVAVTRYNSSPRAQYNAFSAGAQTAYLPSLMKAWYEWTSTFVVHNLSDSQETTITVEYYRDDGSDPVTKEYALGPRASLAVSQGDEPDLGDGWHGSARLTSSTTQVAVVVYQEDTIILPSGFQAYSGNLGAQTWTQLYGPLTSSYKLGVELLDSGIEVQNCGTASADIWGTYWRRWGTTAGTVLAEDVSVWRTHTFYTPNDVPPPFSGAMRVGAGSIPLCGVVNLAIINTLYDQGASYNMIEIVNSPTSSD